jgi:hypothetical protein
MGAAVEWQFQITRVALGRKTTRHVASRSGTSVAGGEHDVNQERTHERTRGLLPVPST